MENPSGKAYWTWWLTLGAVGALVLLTLVYSTPNVARRASAAPGRTEAAMTGSSAPAPAAPAAVAPTHDMASLAAAPAAAPYSAPAHEPVSAVAPPYNPADSVDVNLVMDDQQVLEVAPNTYYEAWTFNGTVPGPVIRVKQGATVNVTLTNNGRMPHSLDFHSAKTPIANYRNVSPGETFSWSFVATVPGVFMYHCGTAPALQHIGNGMYGVMIVDPDPPLPPADHEYVLVQSEFYFGDRLPNGVLTGSFTKMQDFDHADLVAFNGHASQYRDYPLTAEPGETVRFYVVDAGPTMNSSFHVVGGIFDHIYENGNPAQGNVFSGVQTSTVPVGGGSVFDVRPEEAGDYLFVSHAFAQANKGAVGVLRVGHVPEVMGQNIDH
ncbi:MAG TPA: multicopper oxidase domain-containing protein [Chloroflexota bacterium]|nr:multicopper oxidase domain-containing protein [Chloroflexota bacterium]